MCYYLQHALYVYGFNDYIKLVSIVLGCYKLELGGQTHFDVHHIAFYNGFKADNVFDILFIFEYALIGLL